jgi:hypothetical protein
MEAALEMIELLAPFSPRKAKQAARNKSRKKGRR